MIINIILLWLSINIVSAIFMLIQKPCYKKILIKNNGSEDFTFFIAWFDLWAGVYYDSHSGNIYILPIVGIGIRINTIWLEEIWPIKNK